jgi:hypothetical protein
MASLVVIALVVFCINTQKTSIVWVVRSVVALKRDNPLLSVCFPPKGNIAKFFEKSKCPGWGHQGQGYYNI